MTKENKEPIVILDDKEVDESLNFDFDIKTNSKFGHFFDNFV